MIVDEQETFERGDRLRRMMNEYLRSMTPQDRDRTMQIHLAQARGPVRNAMLLCDMTAMLLRARQMAQPKERQDANEPDS